MIDKSPQMPDDVVWHFIGHLQSNKAKALVAGVPNLAVLETLDTVKLANKLQVTTGMGRGMKPLGSNSFYFLCSRSAVYVRRAIRCNKCRLRTRRVDLSPENKDSSIAYLVQLHYCVFQDEDVYAPKELNHLPRMARTSIAFKSDDRHQTPGSLAWRIIHAPPPHPEPLGCPCSPSTHRNPPTSQTRRRANQRDVSVHSASSSKSIRAARTQNRGFRTAISMRACRCHDT